MSVLETMLRELCPNGIERKTLGELGTFYSGLSGKTKADFVDGNAPFLAYKIVFFNLAIPDNIPDKVKVSEGEKQNTIHRGDIIFTGSSETQDEAGMTCVATHEPKTPLYLNSFCFGFRPGGELLLPEFSKYLFRTAKLRREIAKTASGVTRFNISKARLARISIPLPPLPVQEEIVRRLNAMQELVEALETELALRRKQYETVREALFCGLETFR